MKCSPCGTEAVAICTFRGRAVCPAHLKTKEYASGFGQKSFGGLLGEKSQTGLLVPDAVWCGQCSVEYQTTW